MPFHARRGPKPTLDPALQESGNHNLAPSQRNDAVTQPENSVDAVKLGQRPKEDDSPGSAADGLPFAAKIA